MILRNVNQWTTTLKEALDRTLLIAKFLCALHVTNTYLFTPALVYGPSMLPTFHLTGDLVLAERISTRLGKVGPGDVVLLRSPENPRKIVTKRVMGLEGDSVTYVVDPKKSYKQETLVVPKGHVWIQGDNIYASNDSRNFGPVPYGLLVGRVFWRVWLTFLS
ncbi:unnamed protein product [Ilex paraguariensis]|uniref:Peptidase S26 domain-containing protein n=1 Tax=Ilex paraguariensis TaxID=185542 RepID=A0ABC8UKZ4_9AQUA